MPATQSPDSKQHFEQHHITVSMVLISVRTKLGTSVYVKPPSNKLWSNTYNLVSHLKYCIGVIKCNLACECFFFFQQTPLHIASENGYKYTVEALAAEGADISAKDNAGVSIGD